MHRYLVEVSQPSSERACKRIADSVRTLGSHFATHAEWRRKGSTCTGSMVVEAPNKRTALAVVPPAMQRDAQVFRLEAA